MGMIILSTLPGLLPSLLNNLSDREIWGAVTNLESLLIQDLSRISQWVRTL
jgi:hypothetical protein